MFSMRNCWVPLLCSIIFLCQKKVVAYKTFEDTVICHTQSGVKQNLGYNNNNRLVLGKTGDSAAIVQIIETVPDAVYCNFSIQAAKHSDGIYVVIQKLVMRRGEGGICRDYLQLITPKGVTRRTCGDFEVGKTPLESFVYKEDVVYVRLGFDSEPLLPDQKIEVLLVFTSYFNDCKKAGGKARACIPERGEGCILERFWGDEYVNCPSQDCIDEEGCRELHVFDEYGRVRPGGSGGGYNSGGGYGGGSSDTPVTLGAVTTVLLVLLVFSTCLWICRKHHVCCWGPSCKDHRRHQSATATTTRTSGGGGGDAAPTAPPILTHHPSSSSDFEMNEDSAPLRGGGGDRVAAVPPPTPLVVAATTTTAAAVVDDKDPPPSYESLFPEQP